MCYTKFVAMNADDHKEIEDIVSQLEIAKKRDLIHSVSYLLESNTSPKQIIAIQFHYPLGVKKMDALMNLFRYKYSAYSVSLVQPNIMIIEYK